MPQAVITASSLTTGDLTVGMLWHVLYYVVMIAIGLVFTTKRLRAPLLDRWYRLD